MARVGKKRKGKLTRSGEFYRCFAEGYARIAPIDFEQMPENFIPMAKWAEKYGITRQAAFQLFRKKMVRGVKTFRPGGKRMLLYLDSMCQPPKIKEFQRRAMEGKYASGRAD